MKTLKRAIAIAAVLGAASFGCSDDSSSNGSTGNNGETGSPLIEASVEGAATSDFSSEPGFFYCTNDGLGPIAELSGDNDGDSAQIVILVPYAQGGEGTFDLVGSEDNRQVPVIDRGAEIRFRSADREAFGHGTGSLTFTEYPAEAGGAVKGTFNATLRTDSDETSDTVEITNGVIDGQALSDWDCE